MRRSRAAAGSGDLPAQLVDYGRSVLSDVCTDQSEAAERRAANHVPRGVVPVRGGRGLAGRGQGERYHGGSVGRQSSSRGEQHRADPRDFLNCYPLFKHRTPDHTTWT